MRDILDEVQPKRQQAPPNGGAHHRTAGATPKGAAREPVTTHRRPGGEPLQEPSTSTGLEGRTTTVATNAHTAK